MLANRLISAVGTLLLIAFLFSLPSASNVLAVPMQQGFKDSKDCTMSPGGASSNMTCCWREKVPGSIIGQTYCQTCYYGPNGLLTSCDDKELQYVKTPGKDQLNNLPSLQGDDNVVPEPSTDSKLPKLLQKGGALEKLQESNNTLSDER
ncbi:MAG TPA: hypothetical protein VJS91_00635 [Nitrososphaeraceae archaeon]|nr:hypothetical protein [Nitrososphaeraceae archaeon]